VRRYRIEKEEREGDRLVFRKRRGGKSVDEVFVFKKPHSTYVDWWLQYLEQEIEAVKKDLKELKSKLKGGRVRP